MNFGYSKSCKFDLRLSYTNSYRDAQDSGDISDEVPDERKQKAVSIGPMEVQPYDKLSSQNLFKIVDDGSIQNMLDAEENDQSADEAKDIEVKSTPRITEFLPDFGCQKDHARLKIKKIRSENDRSNSNEVKDKVAFSERSIRSSSIRSSFEIKLSKKCSAKKNPNYPILSSSNSSRSKSKKRLGLALTMNPISTTNFKYAIGNLPIKVSRDDDMLFSFRNQVTTNRSAKENETDQLPEAINSKHGKITYLMANLEDNISQFFQDFKMDISELEDMENAFTCSKNDSISNANIEDDSSDQYDLDDTNENR